MPSYDDDTDRHHANRNKSRLRKQRVYQADYRDNLRQSGTPEREDFAAAALRIIVRNSALDFERHGARWEQILIKDLGKRRFDADAARRAFRKMLDRELKRLEAEANKAASDE